MSDKFPLPFPYLPGAEVSGSLADAQQQVNDKMATDGLPPADGSVTTPKLADNSVTSAKIVNGTVAPGDLDRTYAEQNLGNNTAGDLSITGAFQTSGNPGNGANIRTRNTNVISFAWTGNDIDFYIDGTHVLRINCSPFPRTI